MQISHVALQRAALIIRGPRVIPSPTRPVHACLAIASDQRKRLTCAIVSPCAKLRNTRAVPDSLAGVIALSRSLLFQEHFSHGYAGYTEETGMLRG